MTETRSSNGFLLKALAVLIGMLPILSPYAIAGLSMSDVLVCVGIIFVFLVSKISISCKSLWHTHFLFAMLSFFAIATPGLNIGVEFKVFFVFTLYLYFYSSAISKINKDFFFRVIILIGVVSAVLAILQFVFLNLGIDFYDGKLPFEVDKYSSVSDIIYTDTGVYRIRSFFEEPSYLAIFEVPIAIICLQRKHYLLAIITSISCLISGTMLGVIGLFLCVFFLMLTGNVEKKAKILMLVIITVVVLFIIYFYATNDAMKLLVDYYIYRYTNVDSSLMRESSSESERLIGNLFLYKEYPLFNKLVGTGFNQYQFYFKLLKDYSNDIVSTLLNFGILGLVFLITFILKLWKKVTKNGQVFVFFFVIIMTVDHIWFNTYFFYLLSICLMYLKTQSNETSYCS